MLTLLPPVSEQLDTSWRSVMWRRTIIADDRHICSLSSLHRANCMLRAEPYSGSPSWLERADSSPGQWGENGSPEPDQLEPTGSLQKSRSVKKTVLPLPTTVPCSWVSACPAESTPLPAHSIRNSRVYQKLLSLGRQEDQAGVTLGVRGINVLEMTKPEGCDP